MSTTGDKDSLMERTDGTLGVAEDLREWLKLTRRHRQCRGQKVRARRKGGGSQWTVDRDGAEAATQNTQGDGNGANDAL